LVDVRNCRRFYDQSRRQVSSNAGWSKEMVRQYYRDIGYHEKLYSARKNHTAEPDIPALPAEMVDKVSQMYIGLYERLTGEKFR